MIDPRTQYILHKERENALMLQIERLQAARAQAAAAGTSQPWFIKTGQWLKENGFSRLPVKRQRNVKETPC